MDSIVPAESDGKVAPTASDRRIAADALGLSNPDGRYSFETSANLAGVSWALAEQRAKYEALADELDIITDRTTDIVARLSMREAARRIRQVGGDA